MKCRHLLKIVRTYKRYKFKNTTKKINTDLNVCMIRMATATISDTNNVD